MIFLLIGIPLLGGLASFLSWADQRRRILLVACAILHTAFTLAAWKITPAPVFNGWLALDKMGLLFLSLTSILFLAAAVYAAGYLAREGHGSAPDIEEEGFFRNEPEAVFIGSLLFFLATMSLVTLSQRFGLLWVAIEATTLSSAPLIYFHRHRRSLEAAWKYLLICSVGIALALLGTFFLAAAASPGNGPAIPLVLPDLIQNAGRLHASWLKAAFLLLLVGYGTKMGLAPLHTWLPDAHSEAPSVVSALLSGALLNCAFLGILRVQQVCAAAGLLGFTQNLLVGFGLFSMAVAAVFIVGQADYKRLLAYSSVEHMGVMALGIGLGGAGVFGALLQAVNHSLTKAMLFFVAGNLLAAYRTKSASKVSGALRVLPVSGLLWIGGFFAITGSPPFGIFISEFTILNAALAGGRWAVAAWYLFFLAVIFIGMAKVILGMAQGIPVNIEGYFPSKRHEPLWSVVPPALLLLGALILGIYIPTSLNAALGGISRTLGGSW
jgi:hydrogenase-4 component F